LTTLGVYLGLLVVGGAAPQTFAHSATTRNFELVDEIEVKDDLDTNPDSCNELFEVARSRSSGYGGRIEALDEYAAIVWELYASLRSFESYSFDATTQPANDSGALVLSNFSGKPVLFARGGRSGIDSQLYRLLGLVPKAGWTKETGVGFEFETGKNSIWSTSLFNRIDEVDAHRLFASLRASLDLWRCRPTSQAAEQILKNTDIRQSDSKVIVTTHLPRAGLDPLLAINAK